MENIPFNGEKFQSIWSKYFNSSNLIKSFNSIKHAKFYKNKNYPFYVNIGKNITNGNYYEIDGGQEDYKNKTFLIYDVLSYYNIVPNTIGNLKVKRAKQYFGYSVNMSGFKSFEEYFQFKMKSKSRYRYNRSLKRLEACFNINYKIYFGSINKEEYDHIFKYLIKNIKNRFDELNLDNDIVAKQDYYYELAYELICNKEAVLNVIYDGTIPISISFNFVSDTVMYFAITSFNTDYHKYDLGHINIMKLLEWCFDNGMQVLDFSKGYSEYKSRWANNEYQFENHVLYDSSSIKSKVISNLIYYYFVFKQFLRTKNINKIFSKIKFLVKSKNTKEIKRNFNIIDLQEKDVEFSNMIKIDLDSEECKDILSYLYTKLFYKPEKIDSIKIFKSSTVNDTFYAIGDINKIKLVG